jgi:hypothetical protein
MPMLATSGAARRKNQCRDPRGTGKERIVKKNEKMKRTLRLEKEVLLQLDASKFQKIVGGLSFNDACGTAFICGTQVCP